MCEAVRPSYLQIRAMLEQSRGIAVALMHDTLGMVVAEEPVVLERSGVPGAPMVSLTLQAPNGVRLRCGAPPKESQMDFRPRPATTSGSPAPGCCTTTILP